MKKLLLLLIAVSFSLFSYADPKEALSKILLAAKNEFNTPAITAALAKNGVIVWSDAIGIANLETNTPVKVTDIFRIGSISKPMAATLMGTLIDKNEVNLNDPVHKYLPNYPQDKKDIRIRHLLNHTSGIRHYRYDLLEKENTKNFASLTEALTIYNVHQSPLEFTPGTDYRYSSFGYNLLGAIIEEALNKPYGELLHERIFIPASMTNSFLDTHESIIPGRVAQYRHGPNGFINAPYVDSSYKWSAGGVLSNVYDLLKFNHALVTNNLISQKHRELAETTTLLQSGKNINYGYGWVIFNHNNNDYIGHSGTATGGRSYLLRLKDQDVAVAILVNVEKADRIKERAIELLETWLEHN